MSQLPGSPLSIATAYNKPGVWITAVGLPQEMAAFAVGNMGNGTAIEYIDISHLGGRHQPITGGDKPSGHKLCLGLIELTAQRTEGNSCSFKRLSHFKSQSRALLYQTALTLADQAKIVL